MPRTVAYKAQIEHLSVLDENGKLDAALAKKLGKDLLGDEQVLMAYEHMTVCRQYDEVAFRLQRSGRMGTFPQNKGQEAVAIGSALAARKGQDWLVPAYRENAALFLHGLPMHSVLVYWMGDERGSQIPQGVKITPLSVPIGTHMLHAAGIAWASKIRKEDSVTLTYFGDGATSEGDFHEAANFAGVLQVPCVFICQNNSWAISVPREKQTASETFAQKALAYGIPTIQVDGNDLFAVYAATREAHERARKGGGPSFIEAVTYRLADHTTADDASRYRDTKELDAWKAKDPLIRLRRYLEKQDLWSDEQQEALEAKAKAIVQEVVKAAEEMPKPDIADIFDYTFAEIPESLRVQRDTMRTTSLGQDPQQVGLGARAGR